MNQIKKIIVRSLTPEDVSQFANWGTHEDERFDQYNFPFKTKTEFYLWYKAKRKWFRKWIYSVVLEDRVIGYITFRNYNRYKKEGFMGVAFDPNYMDKGYGTEAIGQYLTIVEDKFNIKRVCLKVSHFNLRAKKAYENVGFVEYERKLEKFEDQSIPFDMLEKYGSFEFLDGYIYSEYIYMEKIFII